MNTKNQLDSQYMLNVTYMGSALGETAWFLGSGFEVIHRLLNQLCQLAKLCSIPGGREKSRYKMPGR